MISGIIDHQRIQTLVVMMVEKDVGLNTRPHDLELPPRVDLQKASKVKQIWELWSLNVALAMSTWNDVAVTYWQQVYHQSEESYQQWRRSGMADRFAYERGTYMAAKHLFQPLVTQ